MTRLREKTTLDQSSEEVRCVQRSSVGSEPREDLGGKHPRGKGAANVNTIKR